MPSCRTTAATSNRPPPHSTATPRCSDPAAFRYQQLLSDAQSAVAKQNKSSVFVAVTLAMFTGQLLYGLAVLILPQYARSNGISQSSLGILVGSYSAASLFVSPLLSVACTRFGRRNVLLCGLIGLAMSTVLFAVSSSVYWLALARIVQVR